MWLWGGKKNRLLIWPKFYQAFHSIFPFLKIPMMIIGNLILVGNAHFATFAKIVKIILLYLYLYFPPS
jgi:hypothetical protein